MGDLAVYDSKISEIDRKITVCEGSMAEFTKAINRYIDLAAENERRAESWRAASTKRANWESLQQAELAKRILPTNMVWDGLTPTDCNRVGTIDYRGVFGESYGMKNCNDVPGTVQAKCTACGFPRCGCTAGLTQWCGSGRCGEYRTLSEDLYKQTKSYRDWVARVPEPPLPGPEPAKLPPFTATAEMACTFCNQNVNLSGIQTSGAAFELKQNAIMQSQNCIASLETAKSQAAAEKAAAARIAAERATAANDAAAAAAATAAANAAAKVAADASAAASKPRTEAQIGQNHAAAVDAAKTKIIIRNVLIVVLVLIAAIFVAVTVYMAIPTGDSENSAQ